MANFKWDCPQCATRGAMFTTETFRYLPADQKHTATAMCSVCQRSTIFVIGTVPPTLNFVGQLQGQSDLLEPTLPQRMNRPQGLTKVMILETFPPPPKSDVPDHLPEGVKRRFIDAGDAFANGKYEQAGFSARKALDVAVARLDENGKGNLKTRIDALGAAGLVAAPLVELAHTVRIEGNAAVHDDEDWTKVDAHKLIEFARLFFVYVFSLPAEIHAVREEKAQDPAPVPPT